MLTKHYWDFQKHKKGEKKYHTDPKLFNIATLNKKSTANNLISSLICQLSPCVERQIFNLQIFKLN